MQQDRTNSAMPFKKTEKTKNSVKKAKCGFT